jgi:hypothetical protein
MKLNSLIVAAALGMLSALPASAFGFWNNATYASRFRPDPQPVVNQAKPEVQVAVMATSQASAGDTSKQKARGQRVWCQRSWCASHSH